jgi:hypothetical protein
MLSLFSSGFMVGRTPEYVGRRSNSSQDGHHRHTGDFFVHSRFHAPVRWRRLQESLLESTGARDCQFE